VPDYGPEATSQFNRAHSHGAASTDESMLRRSGLAPSQRKGRYTPESSTSLIGGRATSNGFSLSRAKLLPIRKPA
jgi:hypothetical protein